jgi:hypothetical protein
MAVCIRTETINQFIIAVLLYLISFCFISDDVRATYVLYLIKKHTTLALISGNGSPDLQFPTSRLLLIAILPTAMVFSGDCRGIAVHSRNVN